MGAADFIQEGKSWLEQSQGLTDIFSFPSPPSYHPWRISAVISSPCYCILIEFPFPPALLWKLKNFLPPLSRIIHFSLALASTNSIHFTSIWFLLHLTETIPFLFPSFFFIFLWKQLWIKTTTTKALFHDYSNLFVYLFLFPKWNAITKRNFTVTLHTLQVPKTKRLEWLSKQSRVCPFWKFWTTGFGRVLVGKRIANKRMEYLA